MRPVRALVLLAVLFVISGCDAKDWLLVRLLDEFYGDPVRYPKADTTPPKVSLIIPDRGSGRTVLTESSAPVTLTLKKDETFFLIAVAEDPEGVQWIRFRGGVSERCREYDGTQESASTYTFDGPVEQVQGTPGQVSTKLFVLKPISERALGCAEGYGPTRITISARAIGSNFHGGEGQSAAAVFVKPGP